MLNNPSILSFILLLFFQFSNAQVTEEGGPPPFPSPSDTVSITLTDSVAPSGATPSTYYSTFYPQSTVNVIPSDSTSTTSSNTKTKVILGVVLSLSILFVLAAITLFIIRRRMHKASVVRKRRASWLSHWVPEPKLSPHHHQNQGRNGEERGTPPPTKDAEYPFALNLSTQKPLRPSSLNQAV